MAPIPFTTTLAFGPLLKSLRKQAGMTQRDLAAALGYSESLISCLEKAQRQPDLQAVTERFIPALGLQDDPQTAASLIEQAALARGERPPASVTFQRTTQTRIADAMAESVEALPSLPAELIGRAAEVNQLCNRLLGHAGRLLTLIGPPGIGKTTLALAVAARLQSHYRDGVVFVPLAAANDSMVMAATILAAVGSSDLSPPKIKLIAFLRRKTMLLVLDNLEQISDASPLIAELVAACPGLCILTTSRERLHLRAEQRFKVSSLDLTYAVALFVQRAQTIDADFTLTPHNQSIIEAICQRLDCLPLALELCAAQIDLLAPAELLVRLQEHRLNLLVEGAHDLPPCQRTLRTAIQHSYQLLKEDERRLFRSLGVFVGGFVLPAVETVSGWRQENDASPLVSTLHALISKSLVRAETLPSGEQRFLLLETIREFALEQARVHGEEEIVRQRHFAYFAQLATELGADVLGLQHRQAMAGLDANYANVRIAFFYADDKLDMADARLRLAAALIYYWHLRGYIGEGVSWLHAAMVHESQLSLSTRALAYAALLTLHNDIFFHWSINVSSLAESMRLMDMAEMLIEPCLTQGDDLDVAQLMLAVGNMYEYAGNHGNLLKAREYGKAAEHIFDAFDHQRGKGFARNLLIWVTIAEGDIQTAENMLAEHMRFLQQIDTNWGLCEAYTMRVRLANLKNDCNGEIHYLKQLVTLAEQEENSSLIHESYYKLEHLDAFCAIEMAEAFLDRQRQKGVAATIGLALHQLGRMVLNRQQFERAQHVLDEELALRRTLDDPREQGSGLQWALIDRGQVARFMGNLALATDCFNESIARFAASPFPAGGVYPLVDRGYIRLIEHDLSGALDDFCQCLYETTKVPKVVPKAWEKHIIKALSGIAEVAHQRGHLALAAKLFAASSLDPKSDATHGLFSEVADHNRIISAIPTYRQDPTFAAAWLEGEKLSLDEAIALAEAFATILTPT